MEFLGGLVVLGLGIGGVLGGIASRALRRFLIGAALSIEAGVVLSLLLDWGYSWVEDSPLHLGVQQNVWILTPGLLALLFLVGVARWGSVFAPYGGALAVLQGLSFIPMLLQVERDTSMSFLAAAPILDLFGALLAAFFVIPAACEVIPPPGSHWHRVAFGPRASWIEAIQGLSAMGLQVSPPATVLESGEARGRFRGACVEVTSKPVLWPPGYGIRVRVRGAALGPLPPPPGLASREWVIRRGDEVIYRAVSLRGFGGTADGLRTFLEALTRRDGDSEDGSSVRPLA